MNTRRQRVDSVLAGVVLLLGVCILLAAAQLQPGTPTDPLGPRGFPILLGVGFVGSGIALFAKSTLLLRHRQAEPADNDDEQEDQPPVIRARLIPASVAIVLYVIALPVCGFLLSTPVFVAAMILLQGGARRTAFVTSVVAFPIAVYLLFAVLLGINLPSGFFDPMLLVGGP